VKTKIGRYWNCTAELAVNGHKLANICRAGHKIKSKTGFTHSFRRITISNLNKFKILIL
jgi:hypothetical protein